MHVGLVSVITGLVAAVSLGGATDSTSLLKPCTIPGGFEAECGTVAVPENRATLDGATIRLRVAVVRARTATPAPDPLVYITGGPGGSAISDAGAFAITTFAEILHTRDLVLVDQRGTGGSNRLECPLPKKGTSLTTPTQLTAYVRRCVAGLGTDPTLYTTIPAMDDLADVIGALGYEKVNLYGGSYGGTAVQYFLHQHPERVRTAVVDGATLLDIPIFEVWGRNGERAMRQILGRCARSPRCAHAYPRVRSELFEVIAMLRKTPQHVEGTTVDAASAEGVFQLLSRTPGGAARIPWIAHRGRLGDWMPFTLARDELGAEGASRLVMSWAIRCNERWALQRPARVAAQSAGTYLAERVRIDAQLTATICALFPKARQPGWTHARVQSDAPVLIVVGGADPQDPLSSVAGARRDLPNSRTIVVPNGGHGSVQLGCMPRVVTQFVAKGTADGLSLECVSRYVPPPFAMAG